MDRGKGLRSEFNVARRPSSSIGSDYLGSGDTYMPIEDLQRGIACRVDSLLSIGTKIMEEPHRMDKIHLQHPQPTCSSILPLAQDFIENDITVSQ